MDSATCSLDKNVASSGMDEMLIRLESSTHVASLTKKLEQQFLNESLVDVTLVTEEGKFIHAHKLILSAGSPYFKNMIENGSKLQSPQSSTVPMIICLSGIQYAHLYPLIKYVYTGSVDIPQNDLKVFVKTAFQLKISGLYEDGAEDKKGNSEVGCGHEGVEDGGSDDLSIEAFIKEEQERGYDLADNMVDDAESNEHLVRVGGPPSFQGLVKTSPRCDGNQGSLLPEPGEYSQGPVFNPLPPPLTKGGQSHSSFTNRSNTFVRVNNRNNRKVDSSFPYHCSNCGNGYKCSKSLWRHRKYNCPATESANKVKFVCKICAKAFSRADNLKRHTAIAHDVGVNNSTIGGSTF